MNEEQLISLVRKHKELFDHEDSRYHDHQRRMKVWEQIGAIMHESPKTCKEKWKKIRENFRKARNLRIAKGEQGGKLKPIRFSKELSFLMPYIQLESESVANLPQVTSDDEQSYVNSPPSLPGSPAPSAGSDESVKRVAKKMKMEEGPSSTQPLFQSCMETEFSRNWQEEDPVVVFFSNLGQTVKQFPPDLKLRVKKAVFNVVSDAEEEFIQRNVTVSSSSKYFTKQE